MQQRDSQRPVPGGAAARILRLPSQVVREHLLLILAIAAYVAVGQLVASWLGLGDRLQLSLWVGTTWAFTKAVAIAVLFGYPVYVMLVVRPRRLLAYLAHDLRCRVLLPERLLSGLLVLLLIPLFLSVFSSLKILVPAIHPFTWDPTFAEWDRILHGGRYSWELLQPLFGRPLLTKIVNLGYHLWFFLLAGVLFWQAFSLANKPLRARFFLAFILTWSLIGNAAASLLASVGPCYYGAIVGSPNPFAPLMDYLRQADEVYSIAALQVQDKLWQTYLDDVVVRGHGISAMPSLHVAGAFLFTLFFWQVDRRLGAAMVFFTLLILVGSVHLGWHYAIDGYVSILAVIPIWRLAGWLVGRSQRLAERAKDTREPAPALKPAVGRNPL